MNWKLSQTPRRVLNLIAALAGLGLLLALGFSLNTLFASRSQQPLQTAGQPPVPVSRQVSPTPTPTTNESNATVAWPTYIEPAYGYAVKYPPDWKVRKYLDNVGKPEGTLPYVIQQGIEIHSPAGRGSGLVYIDVFRNPSRLPLLEWLNTVYAPAVSTYDRPGTVHGMDIPEKVNDRVGGKPAIRMEKPAGQAAPTIAKYVANGQYIYRISLFLDKPSLYDQIYSPMLASFRFME